LSYDQIPFDPYQRPREAKAQQGSVQSGEPESAANAEGKERDVRKMFKILREVWLDIGIEKVNIHKGVVTLQANFPWKITFDTLYINGFLIRIHSRTLSISSECNTI